MWYLSWKLWRSVECVVYFYNFYFPTCSFQLAETFLLALEATIISNKIKTILAPSVNLQKWRLEYHQNHSRNTVILKLNGSRSKHWNLILKRSNDSLWTKLSGILAFIVMSSIDCIARTLISPLYFEICPFRYIPR